MIFDRTNSICPTTRQMTAAPLAETPTDLRSVGDWSKAEAHFRGLLYAALARLAAAGYVATLEESRDLIVDFFLEEWSGLVARYKPELARPKTYIYRAFLLYARPKLRRLRRQKYSLADVTRLSRQEPASPAEFESSAMLDAAAALEQLPDDERDVLWQLLQGKSNLNELARKAGVTRYRVREMLADAFGRLLVSLGERKTLTDEEWRIAVALWREGRSPRDAARELGVTTDSIQHCRGKVLDLIGRAIRAENRLTKKSRPTARKHSPIAGATTMDTLIDCLKEAIRVNTDSAWAEVAHHREPLAELLENRDIELSDEEQQVLDDHPEILVRLLQVLGDDLDDSLSPEEKESADALVEAQEGDEQTVGTAFAHVLLPDLSEELLKFSKFFYMLHRVDDEADYFKARTDVRAAEAAGGYPADLLSYGITPMTLLYVSTAARNVYEDRLRDALIDLEQPLLMGEDESLETSLPAADVIREIGMLVECDPVMAKALFQYGFAIAWDDHPLFWEGFTAEIDRESVLRMIPDEERPIQERWKPRRKSRRKAYAG
jgi:RNA polymerase sigma factor (sigma-70 family)